MAPIKGRRASVVVIVVASLFVGAGAVSLRAAGATPFDAILASLAAITTSLDGISNTLGVGTDPEPQQIKLSSALVQLDVGDRIECLAINKSDAAIEIQFVLLDDLGDAVGIQITDTLAPGRGFGLIHVLADLGGWHRCQFTFTGFPNQVRASMNVHDTQVKVRFVSDAE